MRSINRAFYHSKAWLDCRASYLKQHPLCECCLERGEYTQAEHVHHIVWLNAENEHDPSVTLNPDNLKAVCHTCHNKIHGGTESIRKRYAVDLNGRVVAEPDLPPV